MSEPNPLTSRLDDSLFLGPPPSLDAPARAAGETARDAAPPDGHPVARLSGGAPGVMPWWSDAHRTARERAFHARAMAAAHRPPAPPRPPAPEFSPDPAPALAPEMPPGATEDLHLLDLPWWSPRRVRRAEPAERPVAVRPAPLRPVRLPGARPPVLAPSKQPRPPLAAWWTATAQAERAKTAKTPATAISTPPEAPASPTPMTAEGPRQGPWWEAPPRRAARPAGRRVRVSPASSPNGQPWWSEAAWDVRPLPAAKEVRPAAPRTVATPRPPVDRASRPESGAAPPSSEDGRSPRGDRPRAGAAPLPSAPLLSVSDLTVAFRGNEVVRGVTFDVMPGETVALVGESGSGKSVTALSCLRLLGPGGANPAGRIALDGVEVLSAPEPDLQRLRGGVAGMVFQEPMTSLNPLHTVGRQVSEAITLHRPLRGQALRDRVLELLRRAGLGAAAERLDAYPHQLSGGQRQRVMIAVALANDPRLLIADEPTTALDVTIQAQVLELLARLKREMRMAMLLITHDLAIVRRHADRVVVMKDGEAVESGPVAEVFANPTHPYTRLLIETQPHGRAAPLPPDAPELLRAENVKVHFPIKRGLLRRTVAHVKAVDGVSLHLRRGETLGIVGESGSGKTTLGLTLLQLERGEGTVTLDGQRIDGLSRADLRPLRRRMQIVFQDPYGSLSPRMSVGEIVGEGLAVHEPDLSRAERDARVAAALREVNLDPATAVRYPHEFSGGQRQRIAIARALVLSPDLVVLDEPTSALDVSVQAQVVDLLRDLQARRGLAYLFISHDLRVVRALSHRIMVMKDGKVVEEGETEAVVAGPTQAYTRALMAAAFDLRATDEDAPRAVAGPDPRAEVATNPRAEVATDPRAADADSSLASGASDPRVADTSDPPVTAPVPTDASASHAGGSAARDRDDRAPAHVVRTPDARPGTTVMTPALSGVAADAAWPVLDVADDEAPVAPDIAADPAALVPGAIPMEITSAVLPTPADTPAARAPERGPPGREPWWTRR